jgi:hypothetical protein
VGKKMINVIINFMSNRMNLTIFQCLLYFIVGYVMGQHLTWIELVLMFVVMLGIQFITRTKAVADGMVIRQIMVDNQLSANEIIKQMKQEADRLNKDDLN